MKDYEIVNRFKRIKNVIEIVYKYDVVATDSGFIVNDSQRRMVATCQSIDGLEGFMDGLGARK